jgi:hypothetical protein
MLASYAKAYKHKKEYRNPTEDSMNTYQEINLGKSKQIFKSHQLDVKKKSVTFFGIVEKFNS